MDNTVTKISDFFTTSDATTNPLGIKQDCFTNKVVMHNLFYTASRFDLMVFTLNKKVDIKLWYTNDEVSDKLGVHFKSPHRKGLAIKFSVPGKNTKDIFETLVCKVLGKNKVKLSVHELIYNEVEDTITVSYKSMHMFELNKIGRITKSKGFEWMYDNGMKVKKFNKPTFKKTTTRSKKETK